MMLGSYRPGHQDADDPIFADALLEVGRDPGLAAWFAGEQRFDAQVVKTLGQATAPAGLKELILLNAKVTGKSFAVVEPTPGNWTPSRKIWLAMAAALVLAFLLGRQTLPNFAGQNDRGANRLARRAIAYTGRMPALQFVCFDPSEVADWIGKKSVALHMGPVIDKPMAKMQMIGSSTAQWEGKPVIMIALQNGQQMAMLYIVQATDFPEAANETGEIMEKDGWVSETGRRGEHLYVLTTKGTRANLDFPLPL